MERSQLSAAPHGAYWIIRLCGQQPFLAAPAGRKWMLGVFTCGGQGLRGGPSWPLGAESSEEARL